MLRSDVLNAQDDKQISPDWVRISMAAAIELGLAPGRMFRGCGCGCINLLQNYPQGCAANCSYCGLARERPGDAEDNSFIRVAWPLHETDVVAARIAEVEKTRSVGRVCIAQVQDTRAYADLVDMTRRVHTAAPAVPISALVSSPTLNEERLGVIKEAGADIIGIGLDAASEELFWNTRGRGVRGPHKWGQHWDIARAARDIYGSWKVNFHVVVGLGESDLDLVELFYQLREEKICAYLFSFNPEPGTAMQDVPRTPIERTRRIQLVKHLIEKEDLPRDAVTFREDGSIAHVESGRDLLDRVTDGGAPFMTDGCPDRAGEVACNRPYGSYRPGEEFRDYPFQPNGEDIAEIRAEMRLQEITASD